MTTPEDPAGRDELDRRIERALRRLTEPSAEPFAIRRLLTRRQPARRWANWRAAVAAAVSITLAIGAVFSMQALRGTPSASPSSTSGVVKVTAAPSSGGPAASEEPVEVDAAAWVEAAWPALIPGRFGTVDSTAHDRDPGTTLGHRPAVDGPFADSWVGGPADTTYLAVAGPRALADSTQLIVRGRPLAFSRPHFNAGDGSFWQNELIGVVDGQSWAQSLERDVLFQVDEVLGTTLPGGFQPGLVQFTVTAGQVVVDVPRPVPHAEGGDHVLEAGRYLIGERPTADLHIGDDVVLFLRYAGAGGLYGDRYGIVRMLVSSPRALDVPAVDEGARSLPDAIDVPISQNVDRSLSIEHSVSCGEPLDDAAWGKVIIEKKGDLADIPDALGEPGPDRRCRPPIADRPLACPGHPGERLLREPESLESKYDRSGFDRSPEVSHFTRGNRHRTLVPRTISELPV